MSSRDGPVESVSRALQLLSILARHNDGGARFSDLCELTGLSQGTAHRLLRTMADQHFVEQDHQTRRYHLGFAFLQLGAVSSNQMNLQHAAEAPMRKLTNVSGDTAYLLVRTGLNAICVSRIDGSYPVKATTVTVGTNRPLGYGAGPLTLLAFSPDQERADLIKRASYRSSRYPELEESHLVKQVALARSNGFVYMEGNILRAMATLAVPVFDVNGDVQASLSLASTIPRMAEPRRNEMLALLRRAAEQIQTEFTPVKRRGAHIGC